MQTVNDSDRVCPECGGSGLINMGPTNRRGASVHERCDCQPKPNETDQEYYVQRARQDNDEADRLMDFRDLPAEQPKIAAE